MLKNNEKVKVIFAIIMAFIGTAIYALSINSFVYSANLIPGGLSGLSILIQNLIKKLFNLSISYTVINVLINLPAAFLSLKWIGKKFTIFSIIFMLTSALIIDIIPKMQITNEPLLASVFGGIFAGFGLALILNQGVSGGGTDFVSMSIAARYHISIFNYVLIFDILLIAIQGFSFGVDAALYSVIFQFCSTQVLNYMYKRFKKHTLLIVTEKEDEIIQAITKNTLHAATKVDAKGCFSGKKKTLIYTMITEPELKKVSDLLRQADPNVFINILATEQVSGNYNYVQVGTLSSKEKI